VEKAQRDFDSAESQHAELTAKLAEAQAARPTSQSRSTDLKRLAQLRAQAAELEAEVAKFADSDPDRLKMLGQTGERRREGAGQGAGEGSVSGSGRRSAPAVLSDPVTGRPARLCWQADTRSEGDGIGHGLLCSPFFEFVSRVFVFLCAAKGTEVCKTAANRWTGR